MAGHGVVLRHRYGAVGKCRCGWIPPDDANWRDNLRRHIDEATYVVQLPCADCGHVEHDEWGCHHNLGNHGPGVFDCCPCDRYTLADNDGEKT